MTILPQVELQTVTVLGGVGTVGTAELVHITVTLEVGVEHGLVDAGVGTLVTLERLGAEVVPQVVLEVVLVLGDKGTLGAGEEALLLDVSPRVLPELQLGDCGELALLAPEGLHLPLTVHLGCAQVVVTPGAVFVAVVDSPHVLAELL